jgi:O-antigen ligase
LAAPSGYAGHRSSHRAAPTAAVARIDALEFACWLPLAAANVVGGLSFFSWRDEVLALLALPALVLALWPRGDADGARRWVAAALVVGALPLIWLVPLPLDLAAHLPGRGALLQPAVAELGPDRWTTLSLVADDTWQAWLKLVPGTALFLAALRLSDAQRQRLVGAILAIVLVQSLWGIAQLSGDADTPLQFYGADASGRASGGFANRNHYASLLLLGLPVLALFASTGSWNARRPAHHGLRLTGVLGLLLVATALLASRSRAAAGLLVIECVLFGAWLLRRRQLSGWLLAGGGALALGFAVVLSFASERLLAGFELGSVDGRLGVLQRALDAASRFFPLGAGPGTFGSVFPSFDTLASLDKVYINRAHNDALELVFELGAVGLALYLLAVAGIAAALWRHLVRRDGDGLSWACTLGLLAVLVHGAVDYPMRTPLVAMVAQIFLAIVLTTRPHGATKGNA